MDSLKTEMPHVVYRGGRILEKVEIFTIFWGEEWNSNPLKELSHNLNTFVDDIVNSSVVEQLKEYDTEKYKIKGGMFIGSTVFIKPIKGTIANTVLKKILYEELNKQNSSLTRPNPNTLYMVFIPPKVTVTIGSKKSCDVFCGYHDAIDKSIVYSVIIYPNCKACKAKRSLFDAYTVIMSHELCEAITNPIGKTGWYDKKNEEIGDICFGVTKKFGKYLVQKEWSNKYKVCW